MIVVNKIEKLKAKITVPGSKYVSNRALILAALAQGNSTLKNIPDNEDINAAITTLTGLGIKTEKKNGDLIVHGTGGKLQSPRRELHVNESGTLYRFLTALSALHTNKIRITGSKRIQERPILDLLNSLEDLGAKTTSTKNHAPISVTGPLLGGKTTLSGTVSSQYLSALLLVSPFAKTDIEIKIKGELISKSYIDMTLSIMKTFGVSVENKSYTMFKIKSGQTYKPQEYTIHSDWGSAQYFFGAAALVPGTVTISHLDLNSPEAGLLEIIESMGCKIKKSKNAVTVTGPLQLKSIQVDMSSLPDAVQTVTVLGAFADSTTRIKNIAHLQYKESDRINDTISELHKIGIHATYENDELAIEGGNPKSTLIDPHNDHRMAMSFAIAGLKTGIKIKNEDCAKKSFPGFWELLNQISGLSKKTNTIVLVGYRGAGKTQTAKILADKLKHAYVGSDELFVSQFGPIESFVEKNSWKSFRDKEEKIIRNIQGDTLIIDTGGGAIEREKSSSHLQRMGLVVWLTGSIQTLAKRITSSSRPSLTGKPIEEEIDTVLTKRTPLYEKYSDLVVDTDGKTPAQVADEIIEMIS